MLKEFIKGESAKKIIAYIVFGAIGVAMFRACMKEDKLVRNASFTNGKITAFYGDYRGAGGNFAYDFNIVGKEFKGKRGYANIYSSKGDNFVGRSFPVAYDTLDVNNNLMLITPANFKKFNIPFPDSLDWVRQYIQP